MLFDCWRGDVNDHINHPVTVSMEGKEYVLCPFGCTLNFFNGNCHKLQ